MIPSVTDKGDVGAFETQLIALLTLRFSLVLCVCVYIWGFAFYILLHRTEMLQFTEQALADCPRCDITVVGHSLGAAQAALFIADIKTNSSIAKDTDSFYTFGSPRIGNRNWANCTFQSKTPLSNQESARGH